MNKQVSNQARTALISHSGTLLVKGASAAEREQAAARLALSQGKSLLRVDLSQVVSKYIGETEKNLERLLSRAERSGSLLFLDEADALLGKRTHVKDAHDRYANGGNELYGVSVHASSGTVLIGTGQSDESLSRSRSAIPLLFKATQTEARGSRPRKWPP